eukprot:CAMPEP_0119303564 /NCGR_PEP_ID=MMETSP1333-20130426/4990_1 /TAXON_ID=418940 /ORGANISM="Scyphosphaera apsteinii, Strain RCC1455" /LENGTH=86 /DNA_ID=CAMNT_0007306277 /DNA_START=20 /DNA_END=280 /DNA_ORIENTATION=-
MAFFGRVLICFITLAVMGVSGFAAPPNVELQLEMPAVMAHLMMAPMRRAYYRRLDDRALDAIDVQSSDAIGPSAKKADKLATLSEK